MLPLKSKTGDIGLSKINITNLKKRHPLLCTLCNLGLYEDKIHLLLLTWPMCGVLRQINPILHNNNNLSNMSYTMENAILMQFCQHEVISFIPKAL